jgi:hypothetical protein
MGKRASERPEYAWLRAYKAAHGRELLRKHGAHAIGIGWKRVAGSKTDRLALIFYVEHKRPADKLAVEPVPPEISYTPSGSERPVQLATDVVETAPATFASTGSIEGLSLSTRTAPSR